MQAVSPKPLTHVLGRPDLNLISPFFTYDERDAEYFPEPSAETPFSSIGLSDEDYRLIKLSFLSVTRSEGYSPEGKPVFAIPFHASLTSDKSADILEHIRANRDITPSQLKTYLLSTYGRDTFTSYITQGHNRGGNTAVDSDFNHYDLQISMHGQGSRILKKPDAWHRLSHYFSLEKDPDGFVFCHNVYMGTILDGKIITEPIRIARFSLDDLMEWLDDNSLRIFHSLSPKGKLSKSSNLDTFFRFPASTTSSSIDNDGVRLYFEQMSVPSQIPSFVDSRFFDTQQARFSGFTVHPLLSRTNYFEGYSFAEENLLKESLVQLTPRSTTNDTLMRISEFIREYISTNNSRAIAVYSILYDMLAHLANSLFTEEDWTGYLDTPVYYLKERAPYIGGNRIPLKAFKLEHLHLILKESERLRTELLGKSNGLDNELSRRAMNSDVPSSFQFSLSRSAMNRASLSLTRSETVFYRAGKLSSVLAYLIYWKQNPAIEQVVKDLNNRHLMREYYQELIPLPNSTETSSLRAVNVDAEVREFLLPLENHLKQKDKVVSDTFYRSLTTLLRTHKSRGTSLSSDLKDLFNSYFVEGPRIHTNMRHFQSLLSKAKETILVDPMTLHRYAERMDLVQAIPYDVALSTWSDYVRMKHAVMEGGEFEIFPSRSLRMAHDVTMRQFQAVKQEVDAGKFNAAIEAMKQLNLERAKGDFLLRLPERPKDLIDEGRVLNHCVGSYTNKLAERKTIILFLRKKENPDIPFVTIEINPETNLLVQAEGRNRRGYRHAGADANQLVKGLLDEIMRREPLSMSL